MRDLQALLKASHVWFGSSNQTKHDKHRSLSSLTCKISAITVCCVTLFTKQPRKFSLVWNALISWLSEMEQKIRLSKKSLLWREVLSVDSWLLPKLSFCANKLFRFWDAFGMDFLGRQHLCTSKLQLQGRKGAGSGFVTLSVQRQFSIVQTCNIGHMIELFSPHDEWTKGERRKGSTRG